METTRWAMAHGAATHFPLALALCSAALDGAGFTLAGRPFVRDLHAAGYWTMLLAALGSVGAVFSGLFMTKGSVLGHGLLRMHHLFAWPAFGLLVALATWRVCVGRRTTRPMFVGYLTLVGIAAALVGVAGHFGGAMLLAPAP